MTDDQNPWVSARRDDPTPPTGSDDATVSPSPPHQFPTEPPGYSTPPSFRHAPGEYQPHGYAPYGQTTYGQPAQSNGKATTSMVLGIVGLASMFFCYGLLSIVLGPIAFFMGRSAQKEIEQEPSSWSNAGMARAGWIMGLIQTILSIIAIIALGAFIIWWASLDDTSFSTMAGGLA